MATGFTKAFSQVATGTFLSRVMGLVREQVFAHFFGATLAADAFFAAYRIPNLLRDLFAEGALSSAFVPVFKQRLQTSDRGEAFELAQVCFSVLTLVVSVVCAAGILLSPLLVKVMAPGFGAIAGKAELTAQLTAYMFPFLLLIAWAALAMSILNSLDRYAIPALSPALYNAGVIAAVYLICPYLERPILGMAAGVLLGGLGQFLIQVPGLYRQGFRFRFMADFWHPGLRQIARLMTPMIGGLAASRLNIFINTLLASLLSAGSVSYLTYSYRIMHLPLGMIAVALGTVALPKASAQAAQNDVDGVAATFYRAAQLCFFLVIPTAVFFIVAGREVVALLFEHGRFTADDTFGTYLALAWYSLGLIGFAGVRITAPIFYAFQDATLPMRFSLVSVVVNLAANFALVPILGFSGLAAATSLGGLVNFALLLWWLPRRVPQIKILPTMAMFIRSSIAGMAMGILLYLVRVSQWLASFGQSFSGRLLVILILLSVAGIGYLLISFALGNIPRLRDKQ